MTNNLIVLSKPTVNDGSQMWELVKKTTLDLNSAYKYIMMSHYFKETCVVAKENDCLIGFITAFILPEKQDTIFIWQVGVDPAKQGKKIASQMLNDLLSRKSSKKIRYLEATVTPSNLASQSLFRSLARRYHTNCEIQSCFPANLFPDNCHEEEKTFRIGPLSL